MPVGPEAINYMLYRYRAALAVVELDPIRAITLAGKLIDGALPKLSSV